MLVASYAKQTSSGVPLRVSGVIDDTAVRDLAYFDIATLEVTPWAKDVDGNAKGEVPLLLRKYNPDIQLFLYILVGDQWLDPSFNTSPTDKSGFADIFNAVKLTDGFLYGTDGLPWLQNFRVNLAKSLTVSALLNAYSPLITTHLFNGVFLDCCHTSIAWTDGSGGRHLDYTRAGYSSLQQMDTARLGNINNLIGFLKMLGGSDFKVALNGTGPRPAGVDIDFREGLGSLISVPDAITWMETPGTHWLTSYSYNNQCPSQSLILKDIAEHGDSIIMCGPGRDGPSYHIPK